MVRGQCRRFVVTKTLEAHPTQTRLQDLKPYYSESGGCLSGCLGFLAKAPLKLILFPIRKIIAVVTSVRGVPLEITRTVLLGRTLQRRLDVGPIDAPDAERMRLAFDSAFSGMDFRVIRASLSDAVQSVSGWKSAAMDVAKEVAEEPPDSSKTIQSNAPIEQSAANVQQVLEQPATLKLFQEFDSRFDTAFQRLQSIEKPREL